MAKARRAAPRKSRAVIPVIIVLAAVAVALAVWRLQAVAPSAGPAADPSATSPSAATSPTEGGTSSAPSSSAPSSAAPSASAAKTTDSAAAEAALADCRSRVAAGDDVIDAADQGVGHWSEHVQAQTDFNDEDISAEKMNAIFTRTRLAGPDDLKAYDAAIKARKDTDGSCSTRKDASSATNATLGSCKERLSAQDDVLDAGAAAMADWRSHQAAMYRSRHVHVEGAQGIWIDAWEAAPPHIKAFDEAQKEYADAPSCAA